MGKDDVIRFRCTNEERAVIQAAADAERRTLSDYIRLTLVDASEEILKKNNKASVT